MTQYVIQHEDIADIEVPPEVALDDATLATSSAPFIDGASTANVPAVGGKRTAR